MKVVLTAMVLDTDVEHAKLKALFDSSEKAGVTHYVIALDDKSALGTAEWLRKRLKKKRCTVLPFTFADDFAAARNLTLAHLPKETDWWTWADSDDVIEMADGKTISEFLKDVPETTSAVFCNYEYDRDEYGNPSCILTRGRFYRAGVPWVWQDRVHEDVYPPNGRDWPELGLATSEAFLWKHDTSDRPSAGERNFRLLAKMLEEDPTKARTHYYLGNQHFAVHNWPEAIAAYETYLGLSNWVEQKWDALIHQAIAYRAVGMYQEAITADTKAMLMLPQWADSYFGLGESYCRLEDWKKSAHFGEWGVQRVGSGEGIPDPTVFVNMNAYKHNPFRWMAVSYFNLNENDKALACLERAAESRPEPELVRQIAHLKAAMSRERIIDQGLNLAAGLVKRNEPLKAREILRNLPAGADQDRNVALTTRWVEGRVEHLDSKVAYANLYFNEGESVTPDEAIKNIDELPRMKWVLRRLQQMGAKRALEVGVGNAAQSLYLATNGIQVVGIDIDRRRVRDANLAAVRLGLLSTKEVDFGDEEEHAYVTVPDIKKDSRYQVHYCAVEELDSRVVTIDGEDIKVMDLGPFDAVTATEIIEHVPDPVGLLDAVQKVAPVVFVSTPDGTYDGPQESNIQHVRALSQRDLGRLVVKRGVISELHTIASPWEGLEADLVCQYRVGEAPRGDRVVIWCPDTGQDWTPDAIRVGGIGGSETAVIRMAEELADRGYRVSVYAECEGVWNGVRYAKSKDWRPEPCELFVSWRTIGPLPMMKDFAAHRFLWTHDVDAGPASPEQLSGVTLLALSPWHKSHLEAVYPGATIVVSANGIDPERFTRTDVRRVQHRLIYAQSPDRGLDRVLRLLPKIRDLYPDTTLSVFYGFEAARRNNPAFIAEVERLARQPGVTLHGRVGQDRLAEEYLKADCLIYPATMPDGKPFDETYCISVVEAQAAGCFPVTTDHGALRTTNDAGAHVRLDTFDHDALFQLFAFWGRPLKEQKVMRERCRKFGLAQTWSAVADQWVSLIAAVPALVPEAPQRRVDVLGAIAREAAAQ